MRLLPQSHEENALKALVHSGHFLPAKIGIKKNKTVTTFPPNT